MVALMLWRRKDDSVSLEELRPTRRLEPMGPGVNLTRQSDPYRRGEQGHGRHAAQSALGSWRYEPIEQEAREAEQPGSPSAIEASALDEVMLQDRVGVSVMLAKRPNQSATNHGPAWIAVAVGRKMDGPRQRVGREPAQPGSDRKKQQQLGSSVSIVLPELNGGQSSEPQKEPNR